MEIEISLANSESESSVTMKVKHNQESLEEHVFFSPQLPKYREDHVVPEKAIAKELGNSSGGVGSASDSLNSDQIHCPYSDLPYHGDDAVDDGDYLSDYDDNDDFIFDNNDDDEDDDYLDMQAKFDNVYLPSGVEATVTWLKDTTTSSIKIASNSDDVAGSGPEMKTPVTVVPDIANGDNRSAASSSSTFPAGLTSDGKEEAEKEHDVLKKYQNFKTFDTVDDISDHHYVSADFQGRQPPKTWAKKIHDEWKILEKGLPDTIYVRVYETRMDLLRAVIVGPAGTPYHDGLFVFDVLFPPNYPDIPPMVYYYSGGLRLNPNLYDCGKVCLSLLNTWEGDGNENWMPKESTMLQVLVSIQALILNAKPFFNEPGYENMFPGDVGEKKSKHYNEKTFILSLKTMIYTLRRPPKHYEHFVAGHFRARARDILLACRAYVDGAEVGSLVDGKVQGDSTTGKTGSSGDFKTAVSRMMNGLVSHFRRNGSKDCDEFRLEVGRTNP